MKIIKKASSLLHSIIVALLMLTATVMLISALGLPGGYRLFTVMSGSMEPALKTGSIVITVPLTGYQVGDVITFGIEDNNPRPVTTITHRITEAQTTELGTFFRTRGDANDGVDSELVSRNRVLGKVVVTVPLLGYFIFFVRTPAGFALFVLLPALLFILNQLWQIAQMVKGLRKEKNTAKKLTGALPVLFVSFVSALSALSSAGTNAYYADQAVLSQNSVIFSEPEPQLSLTVDTRAHTASFSVKNIRRFTHIDYELTYDTAAESQGALGSAPIETVQEFTKSGLVLGTCSEKSCLYHKNPHNFSLKVRLIDSSGAEITLEEKS